jgi:Flp pilus assembly protein TadD
MATTKKKQSKREPKPSPVEDHRALGAEALALRRAERFDEALDRYRRAAAVCTRPCRSSTSK